MARPMAREGLVCCGHTSKNNCRTKSKVSETWSQRTSLQSVQCSVSGISPDQPHSKLLGLSKVSSSPGDDRLLLYHPTLTMRKSHSCQRVLRQGLTSAAHAELPKPSASDPCLACLYLHQSIPARVPLDCQMPQPTSSSLPIISTSSLNLLPRRQAKEAPVIVSPFSDFCSSFLLA